ncbi:MAG: discoidin domain-containing protein [Bacteroidaceae bacterium]|nr:discoidin domain-containing protein [Bacteroidaceae bacterium]
MKKIYSFLLGMITIFSLGVTSAVAQEEPVVIQVNSKSGDWTDWNNNPNSPWAKKWESASTDPHLTIHQAKNANNMNYWDGTNIKFFNSVGGSTDNEDYEIIAGTGWNIIAISMDVSCDNTNGVAVTLNSDQVVESTGTDDVQHIEVTDITEEMVIMNVATLTSGSTTFARTSNFYVTLQAKSALDVAWDELTLVIDQYMAYYAETLEESYFKIGTEPGLYGEAEVTAFYEALKAGVEAQVDETDEEAATAALKQMAQNIIDTYEAVLASKVMTYDVADGYYRLRTGMTYVNDDVETVKYMMGYKADGNVLTAIWATPGEETEDQAMALWKITNKDGYLDMQNMYHDGRFNNVVKSKAVTMDAASENLMVFDPVSTTDGVTYFNIRVSTQEGSEGLYLHQGSHGGGTGKNGYLVGWNSTYNYSEDTPAASEWVLEPVDAEEAAAIIEAYEPVKQRTAFEEAYAQLNSDATAALEKAKDYIITALITENSQFSSPWTETSEGSLDNLLDGNASTYWHSAWSGGEVENHTHYLQVALVEPTENPVRLTITRRPVNNDHITLWGVYGSNDAEASDEAWVKLDSLETPYGNNKETITTKLFDTQGYQYLRFYIDGTTTGRGYGHVSEFQLYEAMVNPTSQYALMGDASKNLEAVLESQKDKDIAEVEQADYDALKAAYDVFVAQYVDPAALREVLASVEGLASGIVVGNQPGYWKDASVADELTKTVAEAKAYDEKGVYIAAQSTKYIETIQSLAQAIMDAAIPVETGKWYRIHFGTEEVFTENEWGLNVGAAVVNSEEVETDEALWGKFVTVGTSETVDGVNYVQSVEAEAVRLGNNLYLDSDEDIEDKALSQFRFVAVGDSAYVLQNKGTGLFLKAAGTSGHVTLSIHPSLFSVSAIGYGQNLIASKSLTGNNQNNLHAQRSHNILVTWESSAPGSGSGFYIDEVGEVETDYDGTSFTVDVAKGEFNALCYPVDLRAEEGQCYDVLSVTDKQVTLIPIQEVAAGHPFIYVLGDTEDYDAEGETDEIAIHHGYSFVAEVQAKSPLKGTFSTIDLGSGIIIAQGNQFVVTNLMSGTIKPYTAYIESEETLSPADDITFVIDMETPDGITTALKNVTRRGDIFSLDGRLLQQGGTINDLRKLGRGIYLINGTKVMVR